MVAMMPGVGVGVGIGATVVSNTAPAVLTWTEFITVLPGKTRWTVNVSAASAAPVKTKKSMDCVVHPAPEQIAPLGRVTVLSVVVAPVEQTPIIW